MSQDFLTIFRWWILLFEIGIIFLPVTFLLFKNFADKGYIFSKVLGYLAVSWVIWILGSLKILPFSYENSWGVLGILGMLGWGGLLHTSRVRLEIVDSLKASWKLILFEEVLFFAALTAWAFIRGYQPDIRGLEKFMDFGFVNSILRSEYFPPADMWFAGEYINYYYFGHLISAVLTRLSGVASQVTYNLMIATLFALTFLSSFSIGLNLYFSTFKKKVSIGILLGLATAAVVTLGSNLHPFYWILNNGLDFSKYWYPDATRFIVQQFGAQDNTIHEFPIYSFVVADLHGHLINLPLVFLLVATLLSVLLRKTLSLPLGILFSWLLGVSYITNAWDLPIYSALLGLVLLRIFWEKEKPFASVVKAGGLTFLIFVGSFAFNFPFQISFKNISSGVALADFRSPLWMLLILWGLPFITTLSWVVYLIKERKFGLAGFFASIIISLSWILVILPEFIYVKDIYTHSYQRANTVFKFTYQAFVMFGLVAPYVLWCVVSRNKRLIPTVFVGKLFYLLPVVALFIVVVSYSYFAVKSYYSLKEYRGLDGEAWLLRQSPGEYWAAQYLNSLAGQPVVLQAVGDSYTDFDVISSYTGLPTVSGWLVHEWLWRGSFDEPGKRAQDVETIYTTDNKENAWELLRKYRVSYVVVGVFEKQKYTLQEDKFSELGRLVFSDSATRIYQVN